MRGFIAILLAFQLATASAQVPMTGAGLAKPSSPPPAGTAQTIFITSGTSWVVPSDWNNSNNTIQTWGAGGGGGGGANSSSGGAGGGGGAYSSITNLTLTPSSSVTIQIGTGGTGGTGGSSPTDGTDGGDTWFNGASLAASSVGAKGGSKGIAGGGSTVAGNNTVTMALAAWGP